jgi:hypothetical protein
MRTRNGVGPVVMLGGRVLIKRGCLSPKKNKAVLMLAERSVAEAARLLPIPERTLYRWMKEPAFASALREERRAKYTQESARLGQMRATAIAYLGKMMVDPRTQPAIRIRTIESVLSHAKGLEMEDIQARLTQLELTAEEAKQSEKK